MMQVDYKAFGRRLREYRHARNLTQDVCFFRQPHPILRNTLSNWVLANQPDESLLPNDAIDLNQLPPLHFSAIDEDLPSSLS